jgi:F-type H+-transporting ATPase subunit b
VAIDPLTFLAQVVNFLVLVALLRRFLYRPLLQAMEARETAMTERQAEVVRKLLECETKARHLAEAEADLERVRQEKLQAVAAEVEVTRQTLTERARQAVEAEADGWRRGLAQHRAEWMSSGRRKLLDEVIAVCRKVLAELASTDLQTAVVDVFLRQLQSLPEEQRARLRGPATVHTSETLPPAQRAHIETALYALSPGVSSVDFAVDGQGLGVQVIWPGFALGWTAETCLDGVATRVGELLDQEVGRAHAA